LIRIRDDGTSRTASWRSTPPARSHTVLEAIHAL